MPYKTYYKNYNIWKMRIFSPSIEGNTAIDNLVEIFLTKVDDHEVMDNQLENT